MRRIVLGVLALLLVSSYASAQVIRGPEPFGQPTAMRATSPMAYWIWVDAGGGWHVRTTTARAPHVFEGVVTVEGGALTALKPTKVEWGDTIRLLNPRQIKFKFQTMGGMDGFDFRANSPFVRFDLFLDGRKVQPQSVFVGQANMRPAGLPFDLYGPKLQPVVVAPPPVVAIAPPPLPFKKPVRGPEPTGRPWFVATSPMSYWIWTDHTGVWHVRTTTATQQTFHGYVTVEGGKLTSLKPTRKDWNDVVRLTTPAQIQFKFDTTAGTMDGFDFKADSPFIRFDIYINGKRAPQAVKVGLYAQKPKAIPFDLYIPPPPPALAPPVQGPPPMGAPVFAKKSPQGFWVWADPDNTWHVRAVSLKPRLFDGVVYIENGRITGLNKTSTEWGDAVYTSPDGRQVFFHLMVGGFGTDGFDFKASSRDVRFNVKVDKKVNLRFVHVGAMGASPAGMPFFSTNAAPVVVAPPPPPPPPAGNFIYGRPTRMTATSPMAYWIWAEPNGIWNIYVTTARSMHRFHGRIVTQDGVFTGLSATRADWGGGVRVVTPKLIEYDLRAAGGVDGFRFKASTPCIAFYPQIDGAASGPQFVFLGQGNARPTSTPFRFCR